MGSKGASSLRSAWTRHRRCSCHCCFGELRQRRSCGDYGGCHSHLLLRPPCRSKLIEMLLLAMLLCDVRAVRVCEIGPVEEHVSWMMVV